MFGLKISFIYWICCAFVSSVFVSLDIRLHTLVVYLSYASSNIAELGNESNTEKGYAMTKDHWPTLWFFLFMKLSQQINHHPYPWALHYTHRFRLLLCYQMSVCVHIVRRTSIHTFTLVIWECAFVCACGSDGDIAMAVCNGLFFITFSSPSPFHFHSHPWLHVIRFVTMSYAHCVWNVWFEIFSPPRPPRKIFYKIYVGWYYFG